MNFNKVFKPKQKDFDRIHADGCFVQGLESGVGLVKSIFEMTAMRRKEIFGETDVARILDKFDFMELYEIVLQEIG